MISDICIFRYLWELLTDRERAEEATLLMERVKSGKLTLLWKIFFCTGCGDVERLEELIYNYGSLVKEQDYNGRELFLFLVNLLDFLKENKLRETEG